MPRIPRQHVAEGLNQIEKILIDAAGPDKRLSKQDIDDVLSTLAPTQRNAVDAFVKELKDRERKRGVITVSDINRAIRGARIRLAPMSGPAEIESDALVAARRFGQGLVELAERLNGSPSSVMPKIDHAKFENLDGDELLSALREHCSPHVTLSYGTARDVMYGRLFNDNGTLREVYTDRDAPVMSRQDLERLHHINAEHTRPRSTGVQGTPANSDLHHLYPTDAEANGKRSSLPFGNVVTTVWESNGSKLGNDIDGNLVYLESLHRLKTGALFSAAVGCALWVAGVPEHEQRPWRSFGSELGPLFQLVDDVLDGDGYAARHGERRARELADAAASRALERLGAVDAETAVLAGLVETLAQRTA
jgi:hypothetical protein